MNLKTANFRPFFRFRLRTLLLLPLVFAAVWWWVTWPERTARRFVGLLSTGNVESAQVMFDGPPLTEFWPAEVSELPPRDQLRIGDRNWDQALHARRRFTAQESPGRVFHFEAQRGRVHFDERTVAYDLKYISPKFMSDFLPSVCGQRSDIRVTVDKEKKRIVVTIPEDNLSPAKSSMWIHTRDPEAAPRRPQPQSAEQLHGAISYLIGVLDTPDKAAK